MEEEAAASSAGFGSTDTHGMKTDNSAPRSYERRHRKEGGKKNAKRSSSSSRRVVARYAFKGRHAGKDKRRIVFKVGPETAVR